MRKKKKNYIKVIIKIFQPHSIMHDYPNIHIFIEELTMTQLRHKCFISNILNLASLFMLIVSTFFPTISLQLIK